MTPTPLAGDATTAELPVVEPPTLCVPPWGLAPAAAKAMRRDIAVVALVAGEELELTWHLEADHSRHTFHAPELVFIGTPRTTRIPAKGHAPGLVVHNHPGAYDALPSEADAGCAHGLPASVGFGVVNKDVTRLVVMRAPSPPPAPVLGGWCRSYRLGKLYLHIGRTTATRCSRFLRRWRVVEGLVTDSRFSGRLHRGSAKSALNRYTEVVSGQWFS